ncbi:hypothetical protein GCM10007424_26600 [Flavobacterium suaedae]|uniref:DUF3127 domain-containing protein n=1 Tax=Flavobacterium suaedae TaxID=1767027 RepID=A0ABQ1K1I1_9FLAO|nr:hypothetical protein [Flavobacterium suaedae]GGB85225.1 hypothetical protein GCM10007424_26600 [Flavobacterium suaedae]
MAKEKKAVYTGVIAQDEDGNYFCGEYLLDYKTVAKGFNLNDKITIKSTIENSSDKSNEQYPMKSKDFTLVNKQEGDDDAPKPEED